MDGKAFNEFLENLRYGQALEDYDLALRRVVQAVEDNGGVGELTIKFKVKKTGDGEVMTVADTFTTREPRKALGTTIMFPQKDHRLSRRDPRQTEIVDEKGNVTPLRPTPETEAGKESNG